MGDGESPPRRGQRAFLCLPTSCVRAARRAARCLASGGRPCRMSLTPGHDAAVARPNTDGSVSVLEPQGGLPGDHAEDVPLRAPFVLGVCLPSSRSATPPVRRGALLLSAAGLRFALGLLARDALPTDHDVHSPLPISTRSFGSAVLSDSRAPSISGGAAAPGRSTRRARRRMRVGLESTRPILRSVSTSGSPPDERGRQVPPADLCLPCAVLHVLRSLVWIWSTPVRGGVQRLAEQALSQLR